MKAVSSIVALSGLLLLACSPGVGRNGSAEFPRHGSYALTLKDATGEKRMADVSIDGRTEKRLRRYLTERFGLNRCSGGKLKIERGKLAARMRCEIGRREFPVEISGSYSPTSLTIRTSVDSGVTGMLTEERRYRLIEKPTAT